jgi:hypothetical protein
MIFLVYSRPWKDHFKSDLILTFNRRGDHISFEIERGATPLKPSYYLEAMEMYR